MKAFKSNVNCGHNISLSFQAAVGVGSSLRFTMAAYRSRHRVTDYSETFSKHWCVVCVVTVPFFLSITSVKD